MPKSIVKHKDYHKKAAPKKKTQSTKQITHATRDKREVRTKHHNKNELLENAPIVKRVRHVNNRLKSVSTKSGHQHKIDTDKMKDSRPVVRAVFSPIRTDRRIDKQVQPSRVRDTAVVSDQRKSGGAGNVANMARFALNMRTKTNRNKVEVPSRNVIVRPDARENNYNKNEHNMQYRGDVLTEGGDVSDKKRDKQKTMFQRIRMLTLGAKRKIKYVQPHQTGL